MILDPFILYHSLLIYKEDIHLALTARSAVNATWRLSPGVPVKAGTLVRGDCPIGECRREARQGGRPLGEGPHREAPALAEYEWPVRSKEDNTNTNSPGEGPQTINIVKTSKYCYVYNKV